MQDTRLELTGTETGDSLEVLGNVAAGLVSRARELRIGVDDNGQSDARRLSVRELASLVGVPSTTAYDVIKRLPEVSRPTGRSHRYTLDDLLSLRAALGKHNHAPPGARPVRIAVTNFKGGVSKSTLTATLGHYLALNGYRVLCIDVDPQGTLSTALGVQPDFSLTGADTLLPYLTGEQPDLNYAVRDTEIDTLKLIPANLSLEHAVMVLMAKQAERRDDGWFYAEVLDKGLATIRDDFDVILMDCPPNLGPLSTLAAFAADGLIVPMRPAMLDFASSAQFLSVFGETTANNDAAMSMIHGGDHQKTYLWTRVLLTQGQGRKSEKEVAEYIRLAYGHRVLGPEFPLMTAIGTAANRMRTIYDVHKDDVGRDALRNARQVVDVLGQEVEYLIDAARRRIASSEQQSKESRDE